MGEVSTIGLDLAKAVFQAHGADATGKVVFRKRLRREQVLEFFAGQPKCLVAMEACASAYFWARELASIGNTTKLIAPNYVKPFVRSLAVLGVGAAPWPCGNRSLLTSVQGAPRFWPAHANTSVVGTPCATLNVALISQVTPQQSIQSLPGGGSGTDGIFMATTSPSWRVMP